jgi:colanic acid/amylovoran biosynthesis glycosyltransferase
MMPQVAHFVRGFLHPTETFIRNQLTTLTEYDRLIICHHKLRNYHPINVPIIELKEILNTFEWVCQKIAYTTLKRLTPRAARKLTTVIIEKKISILHFHYLVDARFFLPVISLCKLPTVVSIYGYDVSSFPLKLFGYGERYIRPLFRSPIIFLAMSDNMKNDLVNLGCPKEKIIVHYFGTDVRRFKFPERQYEKRGELNILICARLASKKGHFFAFEAFEYLQNVESIAFHVTLVGDGPLLPDLQKMAAKLGISHSVTFKGHIPHHDIKFVEAYRDADIYIQPSITVNGEKEGIPGTLVEAMGAGLPVISTHHAGIPEVVDDGETGLLVNEGDVKGLAEAIKRYCNSSVLRRRMGEAAAAQAIQKLDIIEKTKNLQNIYDSLLR